MESKTGSASDVAPDKDIIENSTPWFNKVLRGEISAVEAYEKVELKFNDDAEIAVIKSILNEHRKAVSSLKNYIMAVLETPDNSSGIWGAFVTSVIGTATSLGDTATLKALIEGEEHGLQQYNDMLLDSSLNALDKTLISSEFVPRQERHIFQLNAMVGK